MASTMSRVKSRGCEVVKRTRLIPVMLPTAVSSSANESRPRRVAPRVHVLAEQLNVGVAKVSHLAGFDQDRGRGARTLLAARVRDHTVGAKTCRSPR